MSHVQEIETIYRDCDYDFSRFQLAMGAYIDAYVAEKVAEALEYKHDSVEALMEWCVKHIKKWDFPQYDNVSFAIEKTDKALSRYREVCG